MKIAFILLVILCSVMSIIPEVIAADMQNNTFISGSGATYVISINPVEVPIREDTFTISGRTDIPAGETLHGALISSEFRLSIQPVSPPPNITESRTQIGPDGQSNHFWSMQFDTSLLQPGEYVVEVSSEKYDTSTTALLIIAPRLPISVPARILTRDNITPVRTNSQVLPNHTTPNLSLSVIILIIAMGLICININRMKKR